MIVLMDVIMARSMFFMVETVWMIMMVMDFMLMIEIMFMLVTHIFLLQS